MERNLAENPRAAEHWKELRAANFSAPVYSNTTIPVSVVTSKYPVTELEPQPIAASTINPPSTTPLSPGTIQSTTAAQSKGAPAGPESTVQIKPLTSGQFAQPSSLPSLTTEVATPISGTINSVPSLGGIINSIINGKSHTSGNTLTSLPLPTVGAAASISGSNNPLPSLGIIINGQTLLPGSTLTASGTTYVLPIGGTVPLIETSPPSLGVPISTLSQGSGLILGGQTLVSGGTVVVSGTTYILPTGGTSPSALVTPSNSISTPAGRPTKDGSETSGGRGRERDQRLLCLTTVLSVVLHGLISS